MGPHTGTGYDWTQPELWQDMAVALERAKFDLILLGDSLAVPGTYQGRMDAYLRYAEHAPFHDPSPLVAMLAAATRRIGLALTLSTTFYPPFLLARLLTTLDHLSRGRMAWNVVTSSKHEEGLNFGYQELLDHDQRYDRADVSGCLCDSGAALHVRRGRRGAGAAGGRVPRGCVCPPHTALVAMRAGDVALPVSLGYPRLRGRTGRGELVVRRRRRL